MKLAEGSRWTDHERIVFLLEAARQFGSTLEEGKLYAALQHLIKDAMPLDGLIVSAFDSATGQINCEYVWSDGQVLDVSQFPPVEWKPDGSGMQSKVILTGKAEIFNVESKVRDANTNYVEVSSTGGPAPVKEEPAAKTAMMVPMILDGKVTGVVQAMSDRPDAYGEDDLTVLEAVVLQMTAAWHHARLYKKAEQDRKFIDRIVGISPDLVYIYNLRQCKSTFSNGKLAQELGYSQQEFQDFELSEILHPDDLAALPDVWSCFESVSDGENIETEFRVQNKAGDWRWFLNRDTPFERDEEGKVISVLGFGRDITSRKMTEQGLRDAEERYRLVADTAPHIVWSAMPDNTIDYVNRRWPEFFGEHIDPKSHEHRSSVMHPEDGPNINRAWTKALEDGTEFECEYRLRRHDGVFRWHLCRAVPFRNEAGEIVRWFGTLFDIQDQKETEEELSRRVQQRTAELEAAVEELEGFTYSVSHDLRGPLRAISAASMILREDFSAELPPEAQSHLLRQAEAAKRMSVLIDDLLKLSRIGRQELTPTDFDLSAMCVEVAAEFDEGARVQVEPGMRAYGDPRLIRFVILNLLENALKFSPDGGLVSVGARDDGYFIKDQGVGFEMEYAPKIFRPFERLVRADEYPGTGIGLANVQRILHRHGGRVWAESEPGKGSMFWFTLPKG